MSIPLNLSSNERMVLKAIFNNHLISRTEIAKLTNTNKATISGVLNQLKEKQMVTEVGEGSSTKSGGRKPILLEIHPQFGYTASIDFTYDSIEIMYNFFNGAIIDYQCYPLSEKTMKHALSIVKNQLHQEDKHGTIHGLLGIAASIHGIVDENQKVSDLPFLDLDNISVVDALGNIADVPIVIENEANLAALYEHSTHSSEIDSLVTLSIHKGIGAGLIFNNKLYRGVDGKAGEIGKTLVLAPEKDKFVYKKIENICSQDALIERLRSLTNSKLDLTEIKHLYDENHSIVHEEIDCFIHRIAVLIYNMSMQINPNTIFINCPIMNEIPQILERIRYQLRKYPLSDLHVCLSTNVKFATLFGASLAITESILDIDYLKLNF